MKKILSTGIAAILLLSASFAGAEETKLDVLMRGAQNRTQQVAEKVKKLRAETQEKVKQKQSDLQKKVAEIKDAKKKEAANKILESFSRINRVQSDHFFQVLGKLDAILQKIKSRAEKAKANGKDVSAIETAVQKAEQLIKSARDAVAAQTAKIYTVDPSVLAGATAIEGKNSITSKLKDRFKELRKQMHDDFVALRDGAMKSARNAVHEAAQSLTKVPSVDKEPAPTSTNQ